MFKDDDEEEENTFGVTRYPCMPSLVALQQMRNRLHLAYLGRKLMKWTALATGRELRRLAQELYGVYDGFAEDFRNAFMLLARSRYFIPHLNAIVTEDIGKKAGVVVQQYGRTVSGIKIVKFEIFETEFPPYPHLGIEKGGQTILETKKAWLELLKRLIMMMQLRAGFLMVELANRNANKKMNVMAKVVIPRTNATMGYINNELEELAREEFFRLKKVLEIKRKLAGDKSGNKKSKELKTEVVTFAEEEVEEEEEEDTTSLEDITSPEDITCQEVITCPDDIPCPRDITCPCFEGAKALKEDEVIEQVIEQKHEVKLDLEKLSEDSKQSQDKHVVELIKQISEVVSVTKDMDKKGLVTASIDNFIKTAEELKAKLFSKPELEIKVEQRAQKLDNTILEELGQKLDKFKSMHTMTEEEDHFNKVCGAGKEQYKRKNKETVIFADNELEEPSKLEELKETINSNQPSTQDTYVNEFDSELGTFITEVKEITKIIKTKNEHGTISVQKKVIKILREFKTPVQSSQAPSQNNSTNSSGNVSYQASSTTSGKSNSCSGSRTNGVVKVSSSDFKDNLPLPNIIAKKAKSEILSPFSPMSDPVERKWNVLSKMVIPRLNLSCQYITAELEEIEREDNFRLKRFKELKIKKQKGKEVDIIKTISEETIAQKTDSTTCTYVSNIVTPDVSIHSVYNKPESINSIVDQREAKSEAKYIDQKLSKSDSETIFSKNKIESIEFIDQKYSNRSNKCCQAESNVTTHQSKYTDSKVFCPTCNTHIQISDKEYTNNCTCTKPGIDTSTDKNFRQNQEANTKSVASTCSSLLINVKLPSDKGIQSVSSDKCCSTIDSTKSNLKEKGKKPCSESISKRDERKPQEENKIYQKTVESVKEIKYRKVLDMDGNIRLEKRTITTTYGKKDPLSKCSSESDMYEKPSYVDSNSTIKESKSKSKGKRTQMDVLKPRLSASIEATKAPCSVTVCCDENMNDQEVQNSSNNSTSQSASVASVDYSSSDKAISACNICSDYKPLEEVKTTQTCTHRLKDTQTDIEKPKSSYCTIKIFARPDCNITSDESTLDILRKILLQASKSPTQCDSSHSRQRPKSDCGTEPSNLQKSICSINKNIIPYELSEKENAQSYSYQKKTEKSILNKENTLNNKTPSVPKPVQIVSPETKHISTDTIIGSIEKSRSNIQKSSCSSKVNVPKQSIIKKEYSVCSCKYKQSVDNTKLKCPCSKSQNTTPEQKTCSCSKVQSGKYKCKCGSKHETTKTGSYSAPNITDTFKTPIPNLYSKCCNNAKTPGDLSDSKSTSWCVTTNKESAPKTMDSTKTRDVSSASPKVTTTCITPKPNLYPKCCNNAKTPDADSKSIDSTDVNTCSKCVSTNEDFESKNKSSTETKDACTQKESYDSYCSQNKKSESIHKPFSECFICGKTDASTSTRRSDRYDVRPLRLLMQSRKALACLPCRSDGIIVKNKWSKNSKQRKCISYNDLYQFYR